MQKKKKRRYSNYWYGVVLEMVKEYPSFRNESLQEQLFDSAIKLALNEIANSEDGDWKLQIISMRYFQNQNVEFVADMCYSSEKTVRRICSSFIDLVAQKAGFK